jgi:hypothetical protein
MTARPPPGPEDVDGQIGVGLMAIAEGMSLMRQADGANLEASYIVYDALYATFRTQAIIDAQGLKTPELDPKLGAPPFFDFLRNVYDTNTATPS